MNTLKSTIKSVFVLVSALFLFLNFMPSATPVIHMIGDSTMANKDLRGGNTERGWGMMLPGYLTSDIIVKNYAVNGRSTKSFIGEGRWDKVLENIKPGDYVFIQFGHNDQKDDTLRFSAPFTSYKENLKRYIDESRAKGATPVLFTSIPRREFVEVAEESNGVKSVRHELVDTHKDYIVAMKQVAEETNTTLIDMNKLGIELIDSLGFEGSKEIFNHVAPKTQAFRPEGKIDDTHFSIKGARVIAGIAANAIAQQIEFFSDKVVNYDIVVSKDGGGDFFTIQDAINSVPDYRKKQTTIFVRNGIYKEKVVVPESKSNIRLIGQDNEKTVITYGDFAKKLNRFGEEMGTSGSATFYVYAPDFTAENITFENSAGDVGQAVAVLVKGDRAAFFNCRFLGFQDTLYVYGEQDGSLSRQYYQNCYVEGTVDFIFGWATAVFDDCEIHSKERPVDVSGIARKPNSNKTVQQNKKSVSYITAASTPQNQKYGLLFVNCHLTGDENVRAYLGRPWRSYAKTVFINCNMDGHIFNEGWHNWDKKDAEKTAYYAEYAITGRGANAKERVKWSKQLSKKEAEQHTIEKYLGDWTPKP